MRALIFADGIPESNIMAGGTATADSTSNPAMNGADKGHDGDPTTLWHSASTVLPHWWKFDFGAGKAYAVTKYTLIMGPAAIGGRFMGTWTLQGSNNDSDWDVLDTQTDHAWPGGDYQSDEFNFANVTEYRYYMFNITENVGDTDPGYALITECVFEL